MLKGDACRQAGDDDSAASSLPEGAVRAAIAYGAQLAREELHPIESASR